MLNFKILGDISSQSFSFLTQLIVPFRLQNKHLICYDFSSCNRLHCFTDYMALKKYQSGDEND